DKLRVFAAPSQTRSMVQAMETILAGTLVGGWLQAQFRFTPGRRTVGLGHYSGGSFHFLLFESVQRDVLSSHVPDLANHSRAVRNANARPLWYPHHAKAELQGSY